MRLARQKQRPQATDRRTLMILSMIVYKDALKRS